MPGFFNTSHVTFLSSFLSVELTNKRCVYSWGRFTPNKNCGIGRRCEGVDRSKSGIIRRKRELWAQSQIFKEYACY